MASLRFRTLLGKQNRRQLSRKTRRSAFLERLEDRIVFAAPIAQNDTGYIASENSLLTITAGAPSIMRSWNAGADMLAAELATATETQNPNALVPQWSYGQRNGVLGPALTLYTAGNHDNNQGLGGQMDGFSDPGGQCCGGGLPFVRVNKGPSVAAPHGIVNQGEIVMHPDGNSTLEHPVVRFTAPSAGTYSYSGLFEDVDGCCGGGGAGVDVHVVRNVGATSTSIFDALIARETGTQLTNFNGTVTLGAGDSLDFVVGPNSIIFGDSTRFNATINLIGDGVLANNGNGPDSDPDGNPLTVAPFSGVTANGAAYTLSTNGSFTYDPRTSPTIQALANGESLVDTFTYTISDGTRLAANATVTIVVNGVTDSVDDAYTVNEDNPGNGVDLTTNAATGVLGNDDGSGPAVQTVQSTQSGGVLAVSGPTSFLTNQGGRVIINADGSFTYDQQGVFNTLSAGQTATDSFTYTSGGATYDAGAALVANEIPNGSEVNPNPAGGGVWSYGKRSTAAGTDFALLTLHSDTAGSSVGLQGWQANDSDAPLAFVNTTGATLFDPLLGAPGGPVDAGHMIVHPANGNTATPYGIVRFTAQVAGTYDLSATWRDVSSGGNAGSLGSDVHVVVNGVSTFDGLTSIEAGPLTASTTQTLTLAAGATVDFVVGPNGTGGDAYYNDGSDFTASIQLQPVQRTVTFNIVGQNDPVDAINDPAGYATNENTVLTVAVASGVLGNDTDIDAGDRIVVTSTAITSAQGATVTMNADGSFNYNPQNAAALQALPQGASVVDTFTYTAADRRRIGAPVITPTAAFGAFAVAANDLLAGRTATVVGAIGQEGTSSNTGILTNGSFGTPTVVDGPNAVAIGTGATLTFDLDTAASPQGYDISNILTYSAWQDNGRVNQTYTVRYSTVDAPNTFIDIASPNGLAGGNNSGRVSIDAPANTVLATRAAKVQFAFGTQQNGHVGYRELDVIGTPSASSTDTATVSVTVGGVNDAPVLPAVGNVTINEGQTATNSGTFSDVDTGANVTFTSSIGSVTQSGAPNSGSWNWTLPTTDNTAGPVSVTITASDGITSSNVTFTYNALNVNPTLAISGNATVKEGATYTLNLASSDPGTDTITSWSINWGDGPAQTVPGNPTSVTHVYGDGPAPGGYTITATATDEDGTFAANNLPISVTNDDPTPVLDKIFIGGSEVPNTTNPLRIVPGVEVEFVVHATDPATDSVDGPFNFTIVWGDGTPNSTGSRAAEGSPITFSHTYTTFNTFNPTVTVTDNDSGSKTVNLPVVIASPVNEIDDVLYVAGTSGADRIIVQPSGGGIAIRYNTTTYKGFSGPTKVVIFGGDGNDNITVSGANIPVEFYGGNHNDYLAGGNSNDLLDGGEGADRVLGGGGSDVLLGGGGGDTMSGGAGHDYLRGDATVDIVLGVETTLEQLPDPIFLRESSLPGRDTINGDGGNDVTDGGGEADKIFGGAGNDLLRGGSENDNVDGGAGDDALLGGSGSDSLYGRAGRDLIIGSDDNDLLMGSTGVDLLLGGEVDAVFAEDDVAVLALLDLFLTDPSGAADELESLASDDDAHPDTLHGEADGDWYLMYFENGDKLKLSSEMKLPNNVRSLT